MGRCKMSALRPRNPAGAMAGALEEGNGTKARQTRRFRGPRGPCAFFAALNLRDPGGSSCSKIKVRKKRRRGARDGAESPRALAGCIARQSPRPFATCCRTAGSKGGRSTHRLQALASLFSKRLYVKSIPNAPSGAVNKMARTATDSTMGPQGSPIARGTEPMAAWTVAFGR